MRINNPGRFFDFICIYEDNGILVVNEIPLKNTFKLQRIKDDTIYTMVLSSQTAQFWKEDVRLYENIITYPIGDDDAIAIACILDDNYV